MTRVPRDLSGPMHCWDCTAEGIDTLTTLRCSVCHGVFCERHSKYGICNECKKIERDEMAKQDRVLVPMGNNPGIHEVSKPRRIRSDKSSDGELASATLTTKQLDKLTKDLQLLIRLRGERDGIDRQMAAIAARIREQQAEPKPARKARAPRVLPATTENLFPEGGVTD